MRLTQIGALASLFLLPVQPSHSPASAQNRLPPQHPSRQSRAAPGQPPKICVPCVHAELSFLASDELRGRGSGTHDEHLAALYAASLFESFGLEPQGDPAGNSEGNHASSRRSYIQRAPLPTHFPDNVQTQLKAAGLDQNQRSDTWNTLALLRGSGTAPDSPSTPKSNTSPNNIGQVVLLTAHVDHLGLGKPYNGDSIYNGADDDASGATAVLELARALSTATANGLRPTRSILFVLFGSEELGGYGNRYFLDHPPVPLSQIVASLEFEMIGRPDPALPTRTLWLTGYERSNLGPTLIAHGAPLSPDPHPAQHFFRRSDNYALAQKGIVAQTVSSFGLHPDYHRPSDDLTHIDFNFLTHSIQSMLTPIRWLANTTWRPNWNPDSQPGHP